MLKNITLSAEDNLIHMGREKANREKTTLNEKFRQWLKNYANRDQYSKDYYQMMQSFNYAQPDRKFTREEMNER